MEGKTMKAFVVVAISILVILEPSFAASDLSLDVESATKTTYSNLINEIREKVKDPKLKYGGTNIPVMAAEAPKKPKFLFIDLKASGGGTITIAISKEDKFNLYVLGYLDKIKVNNKEVLRAHIFREPDVSPYATKYLFPEVPVGDNRREIYYGSNYYGLESKGGDRKKLGLGVKQLDMFINNVYGKPVNDKIEAKFMLIVVQMIAEATRFEYIEKFILENFDEFEIMPDLKMIKLETNWQATTLGIKTSNKKGEIKPVIDLTYDNDKPWIVSKVSQIAPDMGLFKYEGGSSSNLASRFYKVLMNVFRVNNNIGDDEAAEL
ncbi:ribosome-inactivating protein saporin-7-like [Spinacia oleracea]|uniref:rRNA N-glycosylase n=1 Tax=Spinacia oleracea TaxID=3562 RepID=A0A9R0I324_SPIOL|nr:ribosome-inactivating protein saporin-7-like [Spinacia oleracea]